MRKFFLKIIDFMRERYAKADGLNIFLFALYLLCNVISSFMKPGIVRVSIFLVGSLAIVLAIFRFLSKNIWVREKENRRFLRIFYIVTDGFRDVKIRTKYFKTSVFRRCPCCRSRLKLPHKRGKHSVKCPKCSKQFNVLIIF